MAQLHFLTAPTVGRTYPLVLEKTSVGRSSHHALVIDHASVSADHCEILVYGPEVIVREHGSTNGTFVDGVRIVGQRPVRSGQVIRFGEVEARLELEPTDAFGEDTASEQSAIHAYSQWKHGQVKPRPAHDAGPALSDVNVPDDLEETVVFQKPVVPAEPKPSEPPPQAPGVGGPLSQPWRVVAAGLVAVAILVVLGLALRGCG